MDRKVYAICVCVFPLMICSGIIYSIFALYVAELGASKPEIGVVYTIGSVAGAAAAPLFGRLSDKVGRKPIMLLSMATFTLAFFLYSLADNYRHVYFIQVMEGVAWAALGATAVASIADIVPSERRGEAIGAYNTTWYLGWVVGPVMGGLIAENLGFKSLFMICSSILLLGSLLTATLLKQSRKLDRSDFEGRTIPQT